jgi:hypothetical protein
MMGTAVAAIATAGTIENGTRLRITSRHSSIHPHRTQGSRLLIREQKDDTLKKALTIS